MSKQRSTCFIRPLVALIAMLGAGSGWTAQLVKVGAAHFPPYAVRPELDEATGLLPQLLSALNAQQNTYHFVMVPAALPRRFHDFQQGRIDMAIFENPDWGWKSIPHQTVDMGLQDAEVFVAHSQAGRQQSYFDDLHGKRLALFSGYHYAFASFNADPKFLIDTFNATLTYSHDASLMMVERSRADIALVTRSYLKDYETQNKDAEAQLLTSDKVDQVYHHYALLRPQAPIDGEHFSALLEQLRRNGELSKIFLPYRIEVLAKGSGSSAVSTIAP